MRDSVFSLIRFMIMMAEDMIFFALPIAAFEARNRVEDCGLLYFAMIGLRLLSYPLGGVLSDWVGTGKIFFAAGFSRVCICLIAFGILILNRSAYLWWILMGATIAEALLSGMASVAFDSSLPKNLSEASSAKLQSRIQLADQGAVWVAPLLGAILFRTFGIAWIFLCGAIFYFSAAAVSVGLSWANPPSQGVPNPRNLRRDLNSVMRTILENRFLQIILLLTLVDNFLIGLQGASMTPIALGVFHETEQAYGVALTISSIFALLAVGACPKLSGIFSHHGLWIFSYFLGYLGLFLTGAAQNFLGFTVGLGLTEISCALGIYILRVFRSELIPEAHFGKTLGTVYSIQQLTLPLGGLLIALRGSAFMLQDTIVLATFIGALLTCFLLSNFYLRPIYAK